MVDQGQSPGERSLLEMDFGFAGGEAQHLPSEGRGFGERQMEPRELEGGVNGPDGSSGCCEAGQRRSTGSVSSLLFRLLTLYQPGGQQEKVTLLQGLQQPKSEQNAVDAVKSLRAWARWLRRCKELEVAAPDPSLLMRGLSLITRAVLEKEPEVSFRTSLVKSHLQVDTKPSYETVEKFYHHLLAECETLAISSATMVVSSTLSTTTPPLKPDPKMKPMKPERPNSTPTTTTPNAATANGSRSPSASTTRSDGEQSDKNQEDRSKVPCKFFGKTYKGCARAARCPFMHSWEGIEKVGRWREEPLGEGMSA